MSAPAAKALEPSPVIMETFTAASPSQRCRVSTTSCIACARLAHSVHPSTALQRANRCQRFHSLQHSATTPSQRGPNAAARAAKQCQSCHRARQLGTLAHRHIGTMAAMPHHRVEGVQGPGPAQGQHAHAVGHRRPYRLQRPDAAVAAPPPAAKRRHAPRAGAWAAPARRPASAAAERSSAMARRPGPPPALGPAARCGGRLVALQPAPAARRSSGHDARRSCTGEVGLRLSRQVRGYVATRYE